MASLLETSRDRSDTHLPGRKSQVATEKNLRFHLPYSVIRMADLGSLYHALIDIYIDSWLKKACNTRLNI